MFIIRLGIPEIHAYWISLTEKTTNGSASEEERRLYQKWGKAMALLSTEPRHPGLKSHEIQSLSVRFGRKVWQSYLENNTPGAGRMFWVYGPSRGEITIIGLEPHPDDKKDSYKKIRLSSMGEIT